MILRKHLPNRGVKKYRLRCDVSVARQIGTQLRLNKSVGGQKLIESREGFKCGGARAKATLPAASRHDYAAKQAQDRPCLQIRIHDAFQTQRGIANATVPGVVLILEIKRNVHFDLIIFSEALLVNDVADDGRRALRVEATGNDLLIFGVGLFGNDRSGQI